MNVSFTFNQDVSKLMVHFEFAIPKDKNDKNYGNVIIKSTVSVCKIAQGILSDFVVKMIMEDFHKFADFDIVCPMKTVNNYLF